MSLELATVRRSRWRAGIGIAAGTAALIATVVLALTRNGSAGSAALPGPLGPEGVPIPQASTLAPPRPLNNGQQVDGISCQAGEQVLFHIHAHLTIYVNGAPRRVPAGIGIGPPYGIQRTPSGDFVASGGCFAWLHTHAADGIIHTESPIQRTYTLGNFFDVWGQPLSRVQVGPARGPVTALVDRRRFTGDPRQIPLLRHAQIQLEVGRPIVAQGLIAFPPGL
jgi:hypothetical protein